MVVAVLFWLMIGCMGFGLLVWSFVTALRIIYPSRPIPLHEQFPTLRPEWHRERLPVGSREIQRAQRMRSRTEAEQTGGYSIGRPTSIPAAWYDELWLRRN